MPETCVVAGCSNTRNTEKGIGLHKIPYYRDDRKEAKARRKKWVAFVKLKRAKWEPSVSSAICSCHFSPEDFTKRLSFGNVKCQRKLVKDELGVLPVPKFHRNTWGEEEELSHRSRRQVSNYNFCLCEKSSIALPHLLWFVVQSTQTKMSMYVYSLYISLHFCRFWGKRWRRYRPLLHVLKISRDFRALKLPPVKNPKSLIMI